MDRQCFDCLNIFNQMIAAASTKDALSAMFVGKSLFSGVHCPTSEMINQLQRNFGSVVDMEVALQKPDGKLSQLVRKMKSQAQKVSVKADSTPDIEDSPSVSKNELAAVPIRVVDRTDSALSVEIAELESQQLGIKRTKNFVQLYKSQVPGAISNRKREKQHNVFNYSVQKLSSTNRQMADLREEMAKNPSTFYTYGTEFLSQTVPPVDIDEERRVHDLNSRNKWMNAKGFSI